jgi:hypothetical protein
MAYLLSTASLVARRESGSRVTCQSTKPTAGTLRYMLYYTPQASRLHVLQVTRALVEPSYVKIACVTNFDLLFLSSSTTS